MLSVSSVPLSTTLTQVRAVPPMPQDSILLPNGLNLNDRAPGQVRRYGSTAMEPGAWLAARLLLYNFMTFPRLWRGDNPRATADAENVNFQYSWSTWLEALDAMPKDRGSWRELSKYLVDFKTRISHKTVLDVCKAVMELALRDAESERMAYRIFQGGNNSNNSRRRLSAIEVERDLMARFRVAAAYIPRVARLQECIYHAIAAYSSPTLQHIAASAPGNDPVHKVVRGHRF